MGRREGGTCTAGMICLDTFFRKLAELEDMGGITNY